MKFCGYVVLGLTLSYAIACKKDTSSGSSTAADVTEERSLTSGEFESRLADETAKASADASGIDYANTQLSQLVGDQGALEKFTLKGNEAEGSQRLLNFGSFHRPTPYASDEEAQTDQNFLNALRGGNYGAISEFKDQFSKLLSKNPKSAVSQARLGFLSLWQFAERYRLDQVPPEVMGLAGECYKNFSQASRLAPLNMVYLGFDADCSLLYGQVSKNLLIQATGLIKALLAIKGLPEFNLFTVGYALSSLPPTSVEFQSGLELIFKNLDVCFDTRVDRSNPDVGPLLAGFQARFNPSSDKRFCANSAIAPHNFEGFMLVLGDLLIKSQKPQVAKIVYKNAQYMPGYSTWPYRGILEDHMAHAEQYVLPFAQPVNPLVKPTYPTIMFNTQYSCTGCHQMN